VVLTSMTINNPLRRFARCRLFKSPSGYDYFEWIEDSLCGKVRSMVVSLIVSNKTLLQENQHLHRMKGTSSLVIKCFEEGEGEEFKAEDGEFKDEDATS